MVVKETIRQPSFLDDQLPSKYWEKDIFAAKIANETS